MKYKIAIVTEADENVASGHLKECMVLVEELNRRKYGTLFLINEDIPEAFCTGIADEYMVYGRPIEKAISTIISYLQKYAIQLLIFNLRKVQNELILKIKQSCDVTILCIDEFGHRRLDCDIIVNPMIDLSYGKYEGNYKQLLIGNQYLILSQKYYKWNKKEKKINNEINKITISMGGVDRYNTTQRIVDWIQNIEKENIEVNVVLGGGYLWKEKMMQFASNYIHIFYNINFIDALFFDSDLVFCAGGNTLHELACMGTPAVVIPTMPHEFKNGKAFEKRGFGKCFQDFQEFIGVAKDFFDIFNFEERMLQMKAGKSCCDGKGVLRIVDLAVKIIDKY